jgi:chromate reductase, NAD(P)H dehydrogenase (quinone)
MANPRDVAVLVGSIRRESFSRKLARAVMGLAPPTLALEIVEIGSLPLYNPDLDAAEVPAAWSHFRDRMHRAEAVLFVTPEHNRALPAPLKNAIDVGSRPYGKSVYSRKPAAIISCSPGVMGGFGANHNLRQSLVFLDMPTLQQPEAYIGGVDKLLDAQGAIANAATHQFATKYMAAFAEWIHRVAPR